jgi:hypothetical protein
MITRLSSSTFVSSNDASSMIIWRSSADDGWTKLQQLAQLTYDQAFGAANDGDSFAIGLQCFLVVGHSEGYLTIWSGSADGTNMKLVMSVNLRSPKPVNPFGMQNIRGVYMVQKRGSKSGSTALVVTGSENGEICIVQVPDGRIISRTVYNPSAQRGINSITTHGEDLLVANCSVGSSDKNLWYFRMDFDSGAIQLKDSINLKVDPNRPQAFNFCAVWGQFDNGVCWFSSTEEGALWMGTVANGLLSCIGYQSVTSPLGSALAFNASGRLVMVSFNLYEFTTLTTPAKLASDDPERFPADTSRG